MTTDRADAEELAALEGRLGHRFSDRLLLRAALVHRSYTHEAGDGGSTNERLEFLGDAALAIAVSDALYRRFPGLSEGELTRIRAGCVNRESLARAARGVDLGRSVRLGKGARTAGGRRLDSVLADTLEAVIGAVYLDGGLDACAGVVERCIGLPGTDEVRDLAGKDPKTRLQEAVQRREKRTPEYALLAAPPQGEEYAVEVSVGDRALAQGRGATKAAAEREAALGALDGANAREGR